MLTSQIGARIGLKEAGQKAPRGLATCRRIERTLSKGSVAATRYQVEEESLAGKVTTGRSVQKQVGRLGKIFDRTRKKENGPEDWATLEENSLQKTGRTALSC